MIRDMQHVIANDFLDDLSTLFLAMTCRSYHQLFKLSTRSEAELRKRLEHQLGSLGSSKQFQFFVESKWTLSSQSIFTTAFKSANLNFLFDFDFSYSLRNQRYSLRIVAGNKILSFTMGEYSNYLGESASLQTFQALKARKIPLDDFQFCLGAVSNENGADCVISLMDVDVQNDLKCVVEKAAEFANIAVLKRLFDMKKAAFVHSEHPEESSNYFLVDESSLVECLSVNDNGQLLKLTRFTNENGGQIRKPYLNKAFDFGDAEVLKYLHASCKVFQELRYDQLSEDLKSAFKRSHLQVVRFLLVTFPQLLREMEGILSLASFSEQQLRAFFDKFATDILPLLNDVSAKGYRFNSESLAQFSFRKYPWICDHENIPPLVQFLSDHNIRIHSN